MPKLVDHKRRREDIAHGLWKVVDQQGWSKATLREIAREAGVSLGQLQHYFTSREDLLRFAMEFDAEQTARRVRQGLKALGDLPHPRDVLRVTLTEMLPLHTDARASSRLSAAFVLEALHDPALQEHAKAGMTEGRDMIERLIQEAISQEHISRDRNPEVETDLLMALTGFTPLLELGIVSPSAALTAIDQHLDRLFASEK